MNKKSTIGLPNGSSKKLSFMSIYFLGINGIVGSGIFLLPQTIYQDMSFMSVLVLVCAAITVSMVALCYADLSNRFTDSGAAWVYSYHAFGKFVGFEIGLFTWFLGICTLSAEVVALLTTLKNIFPIFRESKVYYSFAIGLIILLGIINIFGTTLVKWVDNLSSAFKLATIILFIIVGCFFIKSHNFHPMLPPQVTNGSSFITHFGNAFSVVFYMFTGFSFLPIAAKRMNNPEKNIPKALILVMISVTILYSLVQIIAIGILGSNIVNYNIPIAYAFKQALGNWGYYLIVIGMLVAIFGVAFAASFNSPQLVASLSNEHKLLPSFLGKLNRFGAPYYAIIITTIISCILIKFSYLFLVACIVVASFIQYVPSILALIKFNYKKTFPTNGFTLKGGYIIPILALIISLYLLTNFTLKVFSVVIIVFIVGVIIYFAGIKKEDSSNTLMKKEDYSINNKNSNK